MILFGFIFSIISQFVATVVAITLFKRTKFSVSWILISVSFLLIGIRRISETYMYVTHPELEFDYLGYYLAIAISATTLAGTFFIKKIFNFQKRIDDIRKDSEVKVLNAIITTEEKARQEFAKELHDGLGPLLSAIKMSVSALNTTETNSTNQKIIKNTQHIIDESVNTIKDISNNLSPHILKNFGLTKALKNFTSHIQSGNLKIHIISDIENKRIDSHIEIVLYRIICELINNTIKHASAQEINIFITAVEKKIEVIYFDNGIGFNFEEIIGISEGMGLSNIQSRIKSIGGRMEFSNNQSEGIQVKLEVAYN